MNGFAVSAARMQQAMMDTNPNRFMAELNEHLRGGCRIVPGTFTVSTIERVPSDRTPHWCVLPNGRALDTVYFCVLELPA